jgi:hypothetical protein
MGCIGHAEGLSATFLLASGSKPAIRISPKIPLFSLAGPCMILDLAFSLQIDREDG